jgi:hypothetical protein
MQIYTRRTKRFLFISSTIRSRANSPAINLLRNVSSLYNRLSTLHLPLPNNLLGVKLFQSRFKSSFSQFKTIKR